MVVSQVLLLDMVQDTAIQSPVEMVMSAVFTRRNDWGADPETDPSTNSTINPG